MLAVLGLLVLITLPALTGVVHDWRVDRQIRAARQEREAQERGERSEERKAAGGAQKSSSKPTEPSTATWYAEARRSKKLVSS
jgi:type II secretory pathway pseudopilin PulG